MYQNQRTQLHLAAEGGHGKIVETLIEAKADLCAQDYVSVVKETRLDADRGCARVGCGMVTCGAIECCAGTHDTIPR